MTLNKMIKWLEDVREHNKQHGIRKSTIEFTAKDIRDLLHQLNELKQVKQDLDVYKKALEMLAYDTAYEPMGNLEKRIAFRKEHAQENIAKYLKKAREAR